MHVLRGSGIIWSPFGLRSLHIHILFWHPPISLSCRPGLCEHFVTAAVPPDTVSSWAEIGRDLNSLTSHQIFLFWIPSMRLEWQPPLSRHVWILKQTPASQREVTSALWSSRWSVIRRQEGVLIIRSTLVVCPSCLWWLFYQLLGSLLAGGTLVK